MRFLMINLLLICLLLFGIGYLAFSNTESMCKSEIDAYVLFHQFIGEEMQAGSNCPNSLIEKSVEKTDLIK